METTAEILDQSQYLTFSLIGEEYGIDILRVREILEFRSVTRVPRAPHSIRGVINLRGSVVPVIDLAVQFGLPPSETTKWTCIVIVEVKTCDTTLVAGVLADSVSQVVELAAEDVEPPPSFGALVDTQYLVGVGKIDSQFVLILNIDAVLSPDELGAVSVLADNVERRRDHSLLKDTLGVGVELESRSPGSDSELGTGSVISRESEAGEPEGGT